MGLFACPMMEQAGCSNAQIRLLGFCISFMLLIQQGQCQARESQKWWLNEGVPTVQGLDAGEFYPMTARNVTVLTVRTRKSA